MSLYVVITSSTSPGSPTTSTIPATSMIPTTSITPTTPNSKKSHGKSLLL